MQVEVLQRSALRFDDGSPVRAASALARLGDAWLVAQDDAVHAALVRPGGTTRLRLLPDVEGRSVFGEADGTKHLKPDLEAACPVPGGVLLLGSGATPARTRGCLVGPDLAVRVLDLAAVQARAAALVGVPVLNAEGACVVGDRLRWFHRGGHGEPPGSVDLDLAALLAGHDPAVEGAVAYDLGEVDGVALAVTDALALPDGRVLVSVAAEDAPDAVADGPVVATGLALLDGPRLVDLALLPEPHKVEGLAVAGDDLVAVVDDDDPHRPSTWLRLRLTL